jgi:hypothetical protein
MVQSFCLLPFAFLLPHSRTNFYHAISKIAKKFYPKLSFDFKHILSFAARV